VITLEKLIALRPRRRVVSRHSFRVARAPQPPRAAELAYRKKLSTLVEKMGDLVDRYIVPNLDQIGVRNDERAFKGPLFNQFRYVADEIGRMVSDDEILPVVGEQASLVERYTSRELGRVMGIQMGGVREVALFLSAFRRENVRLIKSIASDFLEDVNNTLVENSGKRVGDIAEELRGRFGVTQSRADLIAVDQTLKLHSQIAEARQTQAGVVEYVWTTAHDERVRPAHRDLDGTRHNWSDPPPVVDPKTGRREPPGRDFRCRCTASPIIPEFE
jgi:SPP1 gp7 family putative phage head morphogenesis protein